MLPLGTPRPAALAAVVEAHAKDPEGSTLAEFDSDVEWHVFFSQYKSQLIHIVKQAATLPAISQPLLDAAIDRFQAALARTTAAATSGAPLPEHTLEAEVATLDAVLSAVPRELQRSDLPSGARLDGLLEQVLGAPKPSVPTVCVTLAQSVQALVKHLAGSSAAIGACFKYLLDLTLSLPSEGASVPPSSPSPGWRAAFVARNRVSPLPVR